MLLECGWVHNVRALGWVPNLLNYVVDLFNCLLGGIVVHPIGCIELLSELSLDVLHNCVTKCLSFGRECLLDKEATKNPTKTVVDMSNTCAPSLGSGVGVLAMLKFLHVDRRVVCLPCQTVHCRSVDTA